MARILNFAIVILEFIAFARVRKNRNLKESLIFYTQISNLLTLLSSVLLVILGQRHFVEIFRFLSVSMLVMTFFVTSCILVPLSGKCRELLFSGSGLFHHLIIPVLSTVSYLFAEDRASLAWIWLPVTVTLIYGLIMLYLNASGAVDGPYPFFQIKKLGVRLTVLYMAGLMLMVSIFSLAVGIRKTAQTDIKYVFVHGLAGWGSYDAVNEFFPYWGLSGGSIIRYLNNHGYESYAASVDPDGSAWDRACELYAQLTGTRVDYGAVHSQKAGHERFGTDYTGRALMKNFDTSRIALIGHSFGGATIRLFSEILKDGSEEERAGTAEDDLSPFFKGGGDNLVAIVTLAAPTNGTTAYDMNEDVSFDPSTISIPEEYEKSSEALSRRTGIESDGRADYDYASYDMHIDNALALNERISTFDDVYYFAYPCVSTIEDGNGGYDPDPDITEDIFMKRAIYMSKYTGTTKGGFVIDSAWQPNDGLVNAISAGAPFGAPQEKYDDSSQLLPGRWYVMPVFTGDHMSLQGGLTKKVNVKPFYRNLAELIGGI